MADPAPSRAQPDGYYLSPQDYALFQRMAQQFRTRLERSRGLPYDPEDGYQAPETYVVKTPSGGIPAIEPGTSTAGDTPGSAQCSVYQINRTNGRINETQASSQIVYNLSDDDIPGNTWILTTRDKFGTFVAASGVGVGENTPASNACLGNMRWLRSSQCLIFEIAQVNGACISSVGEDLVAATYSGGVWTADVPVYTGLGSTTLSFLIEGETPTMYADSYGTATGGPVKLYAAGCWGGANGVAAFVGGGADLCPAEDADLTCDDTFIVLVRCVPCEVMCGDIGPFPRVMCVSFGEVTGGRINTTWPGIVFSDVTLYYGADYPAVTAGLDYPVTGANANNCAANYWTTWGSPFPGVASWVGTGTVTRTMPVTGAVVTVRYVFEIYIDSACRPYCKMSFAGDSNSGLDPSNFTHCWSPDFGSGFGINYPFGQDPHLWPYGLPPFVSFPITQSVSSSDIVTTQVVTEGDCVGNTGTGTGSGGDGVIGIGTGCCLDVGEIFASGAPYSDVSFTTSDTGLVTMVRDSGSEIWVGTDSSGNDWVFYCLDGLWKLARNTGSEFYVIDAVASDCVTGSWDFADPIPVNGYTPFTVSV